jgi:RNA polymerase sigma-70 factor (ECF subfamily)
VRELEFSPTELSRWHGELRRYGHRLTGDADLSEDLAQEAMFRLLRLRADARPENARAWLFRVVTNLVRDGARTRERRERIAVPPPGEDPVIPSVEFERREVVARVRSVLDQLSPRDQQMLILRESGFDHREIGQIVGVKPQSVSVLLARALERFKTAYLAEATL